MPLEAPLVPSRAGQGIRETRRGPFVVSDVSPQGAGELERTLESLREEVDVAHALLGLSASLAEVRSVEETLGRAVTVVPRLLAADRCYAATWDPVRECFIVLAHAGYDDEKAALLQALSAREGGLPVLRQALVESEDVELVPDAAADPRIGREEAEHRELGAYIAIPVGRKGEQFGGLGVEFTATRRFGTKEEALARGIASQIAIAFANSRQFGLMRELRSFGLNVGRASRLSPVMTEIARGAARLLRGDDAAIYLYDSGRKLLARAHATDGAPAPDRLDPADEPWSGLVEGKTVLVSREGKATAVDNSVPIAIVGAPILAADAPLGGAVLVFFDRSITLSSDQTEALNVLCAQSSMALENAQRYERQRRVARSLQEGLLTTEMPPLDAFHVDAVYEPASGEAEVGGDFFDVFDLGEGRVGVVVGDVSGKGAEAAAQTAQAKYMLRAFAMRNPSPASVLFHLNNALVQGLTHDRFATCMFGVFDIEGCTAQIAIAGHPPPVVYRSNEEVEVYDIPGTILGAFEDQQFEQVTVDMRKGDIFFAYTDGLTEARRGKELFGLSGLLTAIKKVASGPEADPARRLYEEAQRFGEVTDDTVVVALTCERDSP